MVMRCHNPNSSSYARYGAKGIMVCDRWRVYENRLADMGEPPDGMTLDRIDNSQGYSPDNCRWATAKQQAANSSKPRWLTLNGETKNLSEWARHLGIHNVTLWERIQRGWPLEIALTTGKSHRYRSPMRNIQ
jgi:hypothetical protein